MATEHSRCFTRTHMFSTYQFIVMTTATSFLAPVPPRNVVRIQVRVSTSTLLLAAVLTHPWVTQNILLLSGKLLLLYLTIKKCYPLQKSYILKGYLKWRCKFAWKHRKYANISTCLVWWFYAYLYKRCVFLCVLFFLLLFGGRGSNLTSQGAVNVGSLFTNEEQEKVGLWCFLLHFHHTCQSCLGCRRHRLLAKSASSHSHVLATFNCEL